MEAPKESSIPALAQAQCQAEATKTETDEQVIKEASESSPYVQYDGLEDYKMKGYGAHGHLATVNHPRHAGATDAPTPSGSAGSYSLEDYKKQAKAARYVQYDGLEDYKMKGYGAHGHLATVNHPRHAGATDAPAPSGSAVSAFRDH